MNGGSLAQVLNAAPDAVAITRLSDGLIKYVNRGFSELFGYSAEEILGKKAIIEPCLDENGSIGLGR